MINRMLIHGMAGTKIHSIWRQMKNRCLNPKCKAYPDYGGRGITVCDRWKEFVNFWADMGEPPSGYCIHRSNNDGHYEPENCKWVLRGKHNTIHFGGRERPAYSERMTGKKRLNHSEKMKELWKEGTYNFKRSSNKKFSLEVGDTV